MAIKSSKKKGISESLKGELIKQSIDEMEFARKHKRNIVTNRWHKNENLLYGVKPVTGDERANVGIANTKALGFQDTLLSKIDNPVSIKYRKSTDADEMKARYANAVIQTQSRPSIGNWNFKDLLSKKHAIIYGRAIFEFHASSVNGFKTFLTYTDPYDFLIDPSAGGLDIETALYLGRGNIYKSRETLKKMAKEGKYDKKAIDTILAGKGGEVGDEEEQNKQNRYYAFVQDNRIIYPDHMFKFWEWYTTYDDQRYYLLLDPIGRAAPKICPIEEKFESGLYPFSTWAPYPDMSEFWTPAPMDYVREIFMGQHVSINQMLDNSEAINRPHKFIQAGALKNPKSAKYGRDKITIVAKGFSVDQAIQFAKTQSIETPAKVYEILEGIANTESGVNAASRGVADEDKVGIYEGNLANVSDRLGLLNKSYSDHYHRLGVLMYHGIMEHMTVKESVEIVGTDGVEIKQISRDDIKLDDGRILDVSVEASDAETQNDFQAKKAKLTFLQGLATSNQINQAVRIEMEAEIVGLSTDEIKRLRDVENIGSAEVISEADRDLRRLIDGKDVEPNEIANVAYAKYILDYARNQKENLTDEQFAAITAYMEAIQPIVIRNMAQNLQSTLAAQGALGIAGQMAGQPAGAGAQEIPADTVLPDQNMV